MFWLHYSLCDSLGNHFDLLLYQNLGLPYLFRFSTLNFAFLKHLCNIITVFHNGANHMIAMSHLFM